MAHCLMLRFVNCFIRIYIPVHTYTYIRLKHLQSPLLVAWHSQRPSENGNKTRSLYSQECKIPHREKLTVQRENDAGKTRVLLALRSLRTQQQRQYYVSRTHHGTLS